MTEYKDKEIKCSTCGTKFVFEAGEQKFYKSIKRDRFTGQEFPEGLPDPKRCPDCRADRRRAREKYIK
jgi:DNA-directed RNA polymerase subunit RPC12/RpoP